MGEGGDGPASGAGTYEIVGYETVGYEAVG
jgi:hypothetical protein